MSKLTRSRLAQVRVLSFVLWALCILQMSSMAHSEDCWEPVNTGLINQHVRSLAVDGVGLLYAGTMEGGVFVSEDKGAHWASYNEGLSSLDIRSLAADQAGNLYAVADVSTVQQLFSRRHGQAAWQVVDLGFPQASIQGLGVKATGEVYLTAFSAYTSKHLKIPQIGQDPVELPGRGPLVNYTFGPGGLVCAVKLILTTRTALCTTDDFKTVYSGNMDMDVMDVQAMAFSPAGRFYAATDLNGGTVFRSDDAGHSWNPVTAKLPKDDTPLGDSVTTALVIRSGEEVFAARGWTGGSGSRPSLGVFRLNADQTSWTDVSWGMTFRDVRALVQDAQGTLYAGTAGGGIFRSTPSVPVQLSEFKLD